MITKRHLPNHGQFAVYITTAKGDFIRWEQTKDMPLSELARRLCELGQHLSATFGTKKP